MELLFCEVRGGGGLGNLSEDRLPTGVRKKLEKSSLSLKCTYTLLGFVCFGASTGCALSWVLRVSMKGWGWDQSLTQASACLAPTPLSAARFLTSRVCTIVSWSSYV